MLNSTVWISVVSVMFYVCTYTYKVAQYESFGLPSNFIEFSLSDMVIPGMSFAILLFLIVLSTFPFSLLVSWLLNTLILRIKNKKILLASNKFMMVLGVLSFLVMFLGLPFLSSYMGGLERDRKTVLVDPKSSVVFLATYQDTFIVSPIDVESALFDPTYYFVDKDKVSLKLTELSKPLRMKE